MLAPPHAKYCTPPAGRATVPIGNPLPQEGDTEWSLLAKLARRSFARYVSIGNEHDIVSTSGTATFALQPGDTVSVTLRMMPGQPAQAVNTDIATITVGPTPSYTLRLRENDTFDLVLPLAATGQNVITVTSLVGNIRAQIVGLREAA